MTETGGGAELEMLFPDRDVDVRDPDTGEVVTVTVREFRFLEGLRAQAEARALIVALTDAIDDDEELGTEVIADVMAEHAEAWLGLVGLSTGRERVWLAQLADRDGDALSEALWEVNRGFFVRRVGAELARRRKADDPSLSQRSSTPSSAPGTDEDTET